MRIADVVFDVPVPHPFSYRVPDDWTLCRQSAFLQAVEFDARGLL